MNAKHTPGPWIASDDYTDAAPVIDGNGFPVARIETRPILEDWDQREPGVIHWSDAPGRTFIERPEEEWRANAALIAAAPELLEVARIFVDLVNEYRKVHGESGLLVEALDGRARAAIAKAERNDR